MFEQAKKNAPCIIFIDEIDAVGRHRGAGLGGGNDEREQTLNQLLVEMDGFEANEGIIIIAATNRPDVLDPALLRPGRFDRQIMVPNPDVAGREKILRVHMRKVPLAPDVDPRVIARGTPGFSGADLANLVNEAALLAARRNKRLVTQAEFEDAKDKVMMGAERRSMIMTEEEKLATAYHEAGHALVNLMVPGNDPLHKVTIIPRGRALGVTMSLPERDKLSYSKQWCEARIATMFGGRVAEQLIYGEDHLNTGASNDIMQATELARRMVTEWGMSDKLGPLRYNENQQEVFLGHAITQRQNMSEDTAKLIDEEIRRIVTDGEKKAREVLYRQPRQAGGHHTGADGIRDHQRRRGATGHARREDRAQQRRRGDRRALPVQRFRPPASCVRRAPSPAPAASSPSRRPKTAAEARVFPGATGKTRLPLVFFCASCSHAGIACAASAADMRMPRSAAAHPGVWCRGTLTQGRDGQCAGSAVGIAERWGSLDLAIDRGSDVTSTAGHSARRSTTARTGTAPSRAPPAASQRSAAPAGIARSASPPRSPASPAPRSCWWSGCCMRACWPARSR